MSRRMKKQLYMSLVQLDILYRPETWPLKKQVENKYIVFERKVAMNLWSSKV